MLHLSPKARAHLDRMAAAVADHSRALDFHVAAEKEFRAALDKGTDDDRHQIMSALSRVEAVYGGAPKSGAQSAAYLTALLAELFGEDE